MPNDPELTSVLPPLLRRDPLLRAPVCALLDDTRRPVLPVRSHQRVPLDAVPAHGKLVRALLVEKWIKQHRHLVVAATLVAVGAIDPHHRRFAVMRVEGEVHVVAVVRHPHFGLLAAGCPRHRRDLHELGDVRRGLPDGVIETTIDLRRRGRPGNNRTGTIVRRDRRKPAASTASTPTAGRGVGVL